MANLRMIACDWKKLESEFRKRGLKHNDVAEELGHSRSFFHNAQGRNQISVATSKALEQRYNISPDDYKIDDATFNNKEAHDKTFQLGQEVIHAVFGKGVVLSVQGIGDNEKVRVQFEDGTVKMFNCNVAKFQTVEKKSANLAIDWQIFADKLHEAIYNAVREALNA